VHGVKQALEWAVWVAIIGNWIMFFWLRPDRVRRRAMRDLAALREQAELDIAALHAAEATLVEISWTCPDHDHDFKDTCPTCNLAKQGEAALAAIEKAWSA
jgi:hypothetical protein